MRTVFALGIALLTTPAMADLAVTFRDGAPKDRFTFMATDGCLTDPLQIVLDLTGSAAGLIFDITAEGPGVEVSQPFELVSGADLLRTVSPVTDGDTNVALGLSSLPPDAPLVFTIDLDDTIGAREITVSNAEISGAAVTVTSGSVIATAAFDKTATALVDLPDCTS